MPTFSIPPDIGPVEEETPEPRYRCPQCGNASNFDPTTISYNSWANPATPRITCGHCQTTWFPCTWLHNRIMASTQPHGQRICIDCLHNSGFSYCSLCNEYANRGMRYTQSGRVCTPCREMHSECADCNTLVLPEDLTAVRGRFLCADCADYAQTSGNTCTCMSCREQHEREEIRFSRNAGRNIGRDPAAINAYDFRPEMVFHGKGPLFLGMELELETGPGAYDDCLQVVRNHLEDRPDLVFLKSDGSISYGFELVTHPMTYEWARENFPWQMIRDLASAGAYTNNYVGMHIHLSRKGFISPAHIYKWMKFIYRNSGEVTKIARRESFDWAAFDPDDRQAIKDYCKGHRGHARYRAINTQNRDTFEVRVFKSSTVIQEIQAGLGLCDASVNYARDLTAAQILHGGWDWQQFSQWVSEREIYSPLKNEMEVQGCVS